MLGDAVSARTPVRAALLLAFVTALLLVAAPSASAIPPGCDNPDDCPPTVTEHTDTLTVTAPPAGTVTGTGISCPGDCTQDFEWTETCYDMPVGPDQCEDDAPDVALTATRGAGWSPSWSGLRLRDGLPVQPAHGRGQDGVRLVAGHREPHRLASARPPRRPGRPPRSPRPRTTTPASRKVDFYVDDVLRGTDTVRALPVPAEPVALHATAAAHTLKVIAQDGSGRTVEQPRLGALGTRSRSTSQRPSTATSTPQAHVQTAPDDHVRHAGRRGTVTCRTKRGDSLNGLDLGLHVAVHRAARRHADRRPAHGRARR